MKNFSKIDRELRRMLVCTFGYSEVEDEVRKRCIEAICKTLKHVSVPLSENGCASAPQIAAVKTEEGFSPFSTICAKREKRNFV